jgi:4-amino-4-deoxy-L-arabinose transferase-like glycosyltransferase
LPGSDPYQNAAALVNSAASPLYPEPIAWTVAIGSFFGRFFWPLFGVVLALMAFNAFFALDTTYIRDFDEARYGVAASEMLHAHSALVTTYAGATEYWNLKPPLGYWLLELSYAALGETPFALRAPAACCGWILVALTVLYARSIAGAGVALLSGAILATCFGFLGHHAVRSGDLDAPLALILWPMLFLAPRLVDERWARLAMGLILGVAFLVKSFAVLPFLAAIAIYGALSQGLGSWRMWPLPLLTASLIAVTWAIARSIAEDSWEFVYRMVSEDLFQRSTSQIDPGGNSLWDYVGCLFDRLAPWPLFILAGWAFAAGASRRRSGSDQQLLLWCSALVPVVLFTIARTHHSWYIVPTYPAWAILSGIAIVDLLRRAGSIEVETIVVGGLVLIGLIVCEVRVASQILVRSRITGDQIFLKSLGDGFLPPRTSLATAFTPSYSERFLLQVVDGFVLNDWQSSFDTRIHNGLRPHWILVRRKSNGALELPRHLRRRTGYVPGEGFALVQIAAGNDR